MGLQKFFSFLSSFVTFFIIIILLLLLFCAPIENSGFPNVFEIDIKSDIINFLGNEYLINSQLIKSSVDVIQTIFSYNKYVFPRQIVDFSEYFFNQILFILK